MNIDDIGFYAITGIVMVSLVVSLITLINVGHILGGARKSELGVESIAATFSRRPNNFLANSQELGRSTLINKGRCEKKCRTQLLSMVRLARSNWSEPPRVNMTLGIVG